MLRVPGGSQDLRDLQDTVQALLLHLAGAEDHSVAQPSGTRSAGLRIFAKLTLPGRHSVGGGGPQWPLLALRRNRYTRDSGRASASFVQRESDEKVIAESGTRFGLSGTSSSDLPSFE